LGKPVWVPEDPQIVGALGAALFARQSSPNQGTTRPEAGNCEAKPIEEGVEK
jgi:hypothetical protein